MARVFIRQTRTNNKATGEGYFTYRLVRGERIAGKVRQITVLNLGRHFPVLQDDWPLLCSRIEQLLAPQTLLCDILCPAHLERVAQRYVGQLIARSSELPGAVPDGQAAPALEPAPASSEPHVNALLAPDTAAPAPVVSPSRAVTSTVDLQSVDIASMVDSLPRSVGVEHVALHAIAQIGLVEKLTSLGINGVTRACILGNLIGRIAAPGSELATWDWLMRHSALGELLDVDFEGLSHMRLYRASDLLMKHRQAIEAHVFGAVTTLFSLTDTVTLYDLTNTYFEGEAASNPKAQFGRSKEKRSDCPLVTLGLVLDGSGFVRRSKTFEGNVSEGSTLQGMQARVKPLMPNALSLSTRPNSLITCRATCSTPTLRGKLSTMEAISTLCRSAVLARARQGLLTGAACVNMGFIERGRKCRCECSLIISCNARLFA